LPVYLLYQLVRLLFEPFTTVNFLSERFSQLIDLSLHFAHRVTHTSLIVTDSHHFNYVISSHTDEKLVNSIEIKLQHSETVLQLVELLIKSLHSTFSCLKRLKNISLLHKFIQLLERYPRLNKCLNLINRLLSNIIHDSLYVGLLEVTQGLVLLKAEELAANGQLELLNILLSL
jgi:hypothetical protein